MISQKRRFSVKALLALTARREVCKFNGALFGAPL